MSCVNVIAHANRVIAGSDSEGGIDIAGGRKKFPCSKIFPIPHLPGLVTGRGWAPMFQTVAGVVAAGERITADTLGKMFKGMAAVFPRDGVVENTQIVVVTWNRAAERFTFERWDQTPGEGFRAVEGGNSYIGPWDETLEALPDPDGPESMAALVRAQCVLTRHWAGSHGEGGGTIVYAEMLRDRITIQHVGEVGPVQLRGARR